MIELHAVKRLEVEPVQTVRGTEHPFPDILHPEIRLDNILVEIIFLLTHLLSIIGPVPRHYYRCAVIRKQTCLHIPVHEELHILHFLPRLADCRRKDPFQKRVNGLRIMRHLVRKYLLGRRSISQKPGLLYPQPHDVKDDRTVVSTAGTVAPCRVGGEHLLPQITTGTAGHERHIARIVQSKEPWASFSYGGLVNALDPCSLPP